jgi:hypothetical protein
MQQLDKKRVSFDGRAGDRGGGREAAIHCGTRERPWMHRSATDEFLQVFGVPRPLHSDLRSSTVDLTEIDSC